MTRSIPWPALLLLVSAAPAGCARDNPLFGLSADTDGGAGGTTDPEVGTTTAASATDGGDAPTGAMSMGGEGTSTGASADSTGNEPSCGNGRIEGQEECDDASEACRDCREVGRIEWESVYERAGGEELRAVALLGGQVLAAGVAIPDDASPQYGAVVRFDKTTGNLVGETVLASSPMGTGIDGSGLEDLLVSGTDVFAVGTVDPLRATESGAALVTLQAIDDELVVTGLFQAGFEGEVARSLIPAGGDFFVGLANFDEGGYGTAFVTAEGMVLGVWTSGPMAQTDVRALATAAGNIVTGGRVAGEAFVGRAQLNLPPEPLEIGVGPGGVQGLLALDDELVAVGWLEQAGRSPWIGRYTAGGQQVWSWQAPARWDAGEFEKVAIDGAGNLVVVGHAGPATIGTLTKFTPDGDFIYTRAYPELGPGVELLDVEAQLDDNALFVVGRATLDVPQATVGLAMRIRADP